MFDKYYYTKQGDDHIVYEAKNSDDGIHMSLYKNEKQLDSVLGLLGDFTLKGDDLKLTIKNTALKSKHEFFVSDQVVELQSIKLKELRSILSKANINNGANPTQAEINAAKFDYKKLLLPVCLLLASFAFQIFMGDRAVEYEAYAAIPGAIAGWILYDIADDRVPWLTDIRGARLGYIAVFAFLPVLIFQLLIN